MNKSNDSNKDTSGLDSLDATSYLLHDPVNANRLRQSILQAKAGELTPNKSVYLTVVWMLGLIVLISLAGVIWLSYLDKQIPQALIALGSVAVGALGSLFTHR